MDKSVQRRIAAICIAILLLAGCKQAVDDLTNLQVLDAEASLRKDAKSYAADQGVSIDEALRRLELQDAIGDLDAELAQEEPSTYAGLWIQHQPQFSVVVNMVSDAEKVSQHVESDVLAELVEVRGASKSLKQLEKEQKQAINEVRRLNIRADSGINIFKNRAEIYVLDKERLTSLSGSSNTLGTSSVDIPDGVRVLEVDQLSSLEVNGVAGNTLINCTTGYSVRNSSGRKGITTAAHCRANPQVYAGIQLTRLGERFTGPYDVEWHTSSRITFLPRARDVVDDSTPGYRTITGQRNRPNQPLNGYVCKYGIATKHTCGYIIDRAYRSSEPSNATASYVRVSNSGVNLSEGGDSGGPWYLGGSAYGIHHSGIGNDSTYMAINYIDGALGLSILTD